MQNEKKTVWENDDVKVSELIFRKDKKIRKRSFIELKRRATMVIPIEKNSVYLLREYRPLLKKTVWRLPAGYAKQNETPLKAIKRELAEETGLKANKIRQIGHYEYQGWIKFPMFIFEATGLKKTKQKRQFYEKIKLVKVSKEKARKIALYEMEEPHHAFALIKTLESHR